MAKKSFRGGLGSLLENTLKKTEHEQQVQPGADDVEALRNEIELLKQELMLWRNGQLDANLFLTSLNENGLKYDAQTNSIKKA